MDHPVRRANLLDVRFVPGADELFETLLRGDAVRVERIVSTGQCSPPGFYYDQSEDEWVVLLQGNATVSLEDGTAFHLAPGDALFLPAHCRHRVEATTEKPPCVWLALHGRLRMTDD